MTTKLVGLYFHSKNSDSGKLQWQGIIESEVHPGWFLVQTFSWFSGHDMKCKYLVPIEAMVDWYFYDTEEDFKEHYRIIKSQQDD